MEMWQNEACYRKFHSIFHFKLPLFEISSIMSWKVNQVHGVWHCVLGTWEWEQAKKWLCWIKSHSQYCAFHLNNGSLKSRLTPHLCSNFALGQPDCICLNQNFVIWPSKANIGNKSWSWGKSIFVWSVVVTLLLQSLNLLHDVFWPRHCYKIDEISFHGNMVNKGWPEKDLPKFHKENLSCQPVKAKYYRTLVWEAVT